VDIRKDKKGAREKTRTMYVVMPNNFKLFGWDLIFAT